MFVFFLFPVVTSSFTDFFDLFHQIGEILKLLQLMVDLRTFQAVLISCKLIPVSNYSPIANVNILPHYRVAGTSCVDYSPLNGKQKKMDDKGESGKVLLNLLYFPLNSLKLTFFLFFFAEPRNHLFRNVRLRGETYSIYCHLRKCLWCSMA